MSTNDLVMSKILQINSLQSQLAQLTREVEAFRLAGAHLIEVIDSPAIAVIPLNIIHAAHALRAALAMGKERE